MRENEVRIYEGDAGEILKGIESGSIQLTFTSPPYFNAREYAHYESYEGYLESLVKVFSEVWRVTGEGRFLVVNTSPVLVAREKRSKQSKRYAIPYDLHGRLTPLGWDFIDDIIWAKPEPSAKNRNGGFYQHRKPLAYKPNAVTEYLMVYRKHSEKLIDWNLRQYSEEVVQASKVVGEYPSSNLWELSPSSDAVHSAVFPVALCERIVRLYSMIGDTVLDPYAGSGTVGVVARALGRRAVLVERDGRYVARIQARLAGAGGQLALPLDNGRDVC